MPRVDVVPVDGKKLREIRVTQGLEVDEVAEAARISASHLRNVETGNRRLSRVRAVRLVRALNKLSPEDADSIRVADLAPAPEDAPEEQCA